MCAENGQREPSASALALGIEALLSLQARGSPGPGLIGSVSPWNSKLLFWQSEFASSKLSSPGTRSTGAPLGQRPTSFEPTRRGPLEFGVSGMVCAFAV